jgi:dipeptidyl aminopeptidase/acylaminoacyl peptidase
VNERRLSQLLRDAPLPEEREAQERGWRVVHAAFEARHPVPTRPRLNRLAIALAVGVLIAAVALTPAGAKVADLVHDVVHRGEENAKPALTSLPAEGRLLVTSPKGPWTVGQDGSKRLLGAYEDAAWSTHGLFVAVTRGRTLTAVDPVGTVRWSLAARRPVSRPAWSTSAIRVAYLSGSSLRIVDGDGTHDRLFAKHVAEVTPAWRPLREPVPAGQLATGPGTNVLAYADRHGRVSVRDVDSGRLLLRSPPGPTPIELSWSSDGQRLLSVSHHAFSTFEAGSRFPVTASPPHRWTIRAASFTPGTHRVAAVETKGHSPATNRSVVLFGRTDVKNFLSRQLFAGPGRFEDVAWSPDAKWLLVGWRDADQWLFLRRSAGKVRAVGHISRQFDPGANGQPPFPSIGGWCCAQ